MSIVVLVSLNCSQWGLPANSRQSVANRYRDEGQKAYNAGNYEAALANWRTAEEYLPHDEQLQYLVGKAYLDMGEAARAVQRFQKAIQMNPSFFQARSELADAMLQQGKILPAIREYDKAFQLIAGFYNSGRKSGVLNIQGRQKAQLYLKQSLAASEIKTKKRFLNQAVQADISFAEAYHQLALVYFYNDQADSAALFFWRAIFQNPSNPEAWNNLGYIFSENDDHRTAIRFYVNAIRQKNDYYDAFNNMAVSFYRLGRDRTAKEIWQQILQIDPQNKIARRWLDSVGSG